MSVLVVTSDPVFVDDAQRWCAAVGVVPDCAFDARAARRGWRDAIAVIVDADAMEQLAEADLARRDHLVVVARRPDEAWRAAVALGAAALVERHDDAAVLGSLAAAVDGSGEACMIAMVGAAGGVGVSTLAAATAFLGARRGAAAVLVDGDPSGAGIDLLVGAEGEPGLRWPDLDLAHDHVKASSLVAALPSREGVSLVSFDRRVATGAAAPTPVLSAVTRGGDLVVADVPRHLDALGLDLVARSTLTVLVVPERVRAVAAAQLLVERLTDLAAAVVVVSRAAPAGLGRHDVARILGLAVVARIGGDRAVAPQAEHGLALPRSGTVRRAAGVVLDAVGVTG